MRNIVLNFLCHLSAGGTAISGDCHAQCHVPCLILFSGDKRIYKLKLGAI